MMTWIVTLAWLALAAIHATPAMAAFRPAMVARLYGVPADGALALLLTHRGALFVAVTAVSIYAAVAPDARRAALLVTGISVISFLILYARAGMPGGPLRAIARVDVVALIPLAIVAIDAIRRH